MFARVTHIQSTPENLEEVVALYRSDVLPGLQSDPAFRGTLVLTDPKTGKGMSLTLWATQAERDASGRQEVLVEQMKRVAPLLTARPVLEDFQSDLVVW